MKALLAPVLAFLLAPCFADEDHRAPQPQPQGGMQAGVQPKAEDVQGRFNKELDELLGSQHPGSEVSSKDKDRILKRVAGMSDSQREEFLNRYVQLDDLKHKMQELQKTDPEAAKALRPQIREHREALWQLDPETTRMLARAYWGSSHSDGMRRGWDGPHSRPGPDQMQDARDWARIGRDDNVIQRGIGEVLRAGGDYPGASQAYHRAVSLNPTDGKALTGLSQVQAEAGNYEAAVETARRALSVDPKNAVAYGMVKMYQGRSSPTNEIAGGGAPAGTQLFSRQDSSGDYGKGSGAFEVRQQAAGRQAPPPGLRESVELAESASRRFAVKDYEGAKAAAEKALSLHPENLRALWALYQANAMRKDYPAALNAVEKALTIDGSNTNLLNAKSNILSRLGRYEDALETADTVLSASPGDASALFNKSFALSGLGRREEALTYLRQAAERESRYRPFYERATALPPDADLVSLFTGEGGEKAAPKEAPGGGHKFRWAAVAGGVLAGLLLIVLGVSQGGTLVTSITRGLARVGSASPAVQPMPVGTPLPPDGLAASGIRIDKKIGQGGMGVVYAGMDTSLERPVAIKKMREEIRSDLREKDRFIKEAKMVAALRHPNIVEIYSIVEDGQDVYLVFEYVTGKTVHDLTYERGALPAAWAIGVIRAVASALDYAHKKGVVHRDLKPSNIMVEEEGMVKVMDFGVARMAKDSLSRMSMTNTVVGTPPYMAPEQEQGIVRRESDVYALGVCLFEMVTGTLPFQGIGAGMLMAKLNGTYVPASRIVQGLPPGFDEVMAMALAPDPDKRLKTAGDFAAALSTLPVA